MLSARGRPRLLSATPAEVTTALVNGATPNVVTGPGTGSPNKLLKIVP
ncbi:uncharacterized protein YraI [Streptomyces sp. 3330]|nr:hypothetical protein [Streptomyces sp. 3330]MDR6978756.1 uncharacterized protein YraI [Streptomyces sp. 3330]